MPNHELDVLVGEKSLPGRSIVGEDYQRTMLRLYSCTNRVMMELVEQLEFYAKLDRYGGASISLVKLVGSECVIGGNFNFWLLPNSTSRG